MRKRHVLQLGTTAALVLATVSVVYVVTADPAPDWANVTALLMWALPTFPLAAPLWMWARTPLPDNSGVLSVSPHNPDVYNTVRHLNTQSGDNDQPLSLVEGAVLVDGAVTDRLILGALLDLARRADAKFVVEHTDGRSDIFVIFDRDALARSATYPWDTALLPLVPEGKVRLGGLLAELRNHPLWRSAMYQFCRVVTGRAGERGYVHLWPAYLYLCTAVVAVASWALPLFTSVILAPVGFVLAWLNWKIVRYFERTGAFLIRTRKGRREAALWWEYRRWLETGTRLDEASVLSYALWRELLVDAVALGVATRFMNETEVKDRLVENWVSGKEFDQYQTAKRRSQNPAQSDAVEPGSGSSGTPAQH